jgi:hypothetical protein
LPRQWVGYALAPVQIDELAVFVKKADSYLSDIYHLHMEFLPPDAIQIVGNKEVTCRMIALAFREITVQENKVRILILRDRSGCTSLRSG